MIHKVSFLRLWERLRANYWFLPMLMVLGICLLAAVILHIDIQLDGQLSDIRFLYGGSADGAKNLLSTLAGSLITVSGVVLSIMIVVMSLASQQLGPRLLLNFLKDWRNQLMIGTFMSAFIFDLLVLTQVREPAQGQVPFTPRLSITLSIVLAILNFLVLIFFIHHMARSVQVDTIIARVAADLSSEIDQLYPEDIGVERTDVEGALPPHISPDSDSNSWAVHSDRDGYIETIDGDEVLHVASEHDLLVRLEFRPGHYVTEEAILARVWPRERLTNEISARLRKAFSLSAWRTPTQDVEFPVNQLVEVACRALSPGVNDPFTAMTCVDTLAAALSRLARRRFPSPYRHDSGGTLRVIATTTSFRGILDAATSQIRQAARDNVAISLRLLEMLGRVGAHAYREQDRQELLRHAGMIRHAILQHVGEQADIDEVEERYRHVADICRNPQRPPRPHAA